MGYSIGTQARSLKLRQRMLDFMDAEYRSAGVLAGDPDALAHSSPPRVDMDYLRGKRVIGVDYSGLAGFERAWAYSLVRWMSLKIGTRRSQYGCLKKNLDGPVPAMLTDEEPWPVIVADSLEGIDSALHWCCTDSLGVPLEVPLDLGPKYMDQEGWVVIRTELKRLDDLWSLS